MSVRYTESIIDLNSDTSQLNNTHELITNCATLNII